MVQLFKDFKPKYRALFKSAVTTVQYSCKIRA